MFDSEEEKACRQLVTLALQEDLAAGGDITSRATIASDLQGQAAFVARGAGVLAGMPAVAMVLTAVHAEIRLQVLAGEGERIRAGQVLARCRGPLPAILLAERSALNFLQYLSGIATLTRAYVDAVAGLPVQVLDTRKTLPGWRRLAKYAVRQGGGTNHRLGLWDAVLIKDNHLAALADQPEPIDAALTAVRRLTPVGTTVEIEVDDLNQLERALAARPDIVLLDNMNLEQLREAVRRRAAVAPQVLLEASGGVNLQTVRAIAETGVDRISVGALTHSVPALDIGLDYEAGPLAG